MQVTYACPHCDATVVSRLDDTATEFNCSTCGESQTIPEGALIAGQQVRRCVVCAGDELFIRKDFPQRLGITIVAVAIVLSSIAWHYHYIALTYMILFGSAVLDLVLWMAMGNLLECYRCHAQYRGLASLEGHEAFDLETHEKHRQQRIRLQEAEQDARRITTT